MLALLIIALGFVLALIIYAVVSDPDWLSAQAKAERQLYAARRSRELNELRQAMRRDAERLCSEIDDEFRSGP